MPGDGRREAQTLLRVQFRGKGRPNFPDRDRHCATPGAATFPAPHPPRLMQPTQVGGLGPLPSGGSPAFTVRQSVAISAGLRLPVSAPAWPSEPLRTRRKQEAATCART